MREGLCLMGTQQGKGSAMLTGVENAVLRHPWDGTQHKAGSSSSSQSLQPPPAETGTPQGLVVHLRDLCTLRTTASQGLENPGDPCNLGI